MLCGLSLELPASVCDNMSVLVAQKDASETAAVDVLANSQAGVAMTLLLACQVSSMARSAISGSRSGSRQPPVGTLTTALREQLPS
jgi:hypothetical protein